MEPEVLPSGVTLRDWDDVDSTRSAIYDRAMSSMKAKFPMTQNGVRMELHDLHYADPPTVDLAAQKEALMMNKFLHRRMRGTWRLFDDVTGEQLEEKVETVMKVPMLTALGTFTHNGSDYTTNRQARLRPGAFARQKATGELETQFNVKRGTGNSFRLRLEPETGLFRLDINNSNLRLYSLLKDLDVPDEKIEAAWGPELLKVNKEAYDARVFDKAHARLVRRPAEFGDKAQKVRELTEALQAMRFSREVMSRTLGVV